MSKIVLGDIYYVYLFNDTPIKGSFNELKSKFYICDVCRIKYDLIFHTEDDTVSKNSIIDQLDLGINLLTRDEYYQVSVQTL